MFKKIFDDYKNKQEEKIVKCDEYTKDIKRCTNSLVEYYQNNNQYLDLRLSNIFLKETRNELVYLDKKLPFNKRTKGYEEFLIAEENYLKEVSNFMRKISKHNDDVIDGMLDYAYDLIGKVDGHLLDENQMRAVLKQERNHLVVAGAGTGKSKTIIGKIKYLLERNIYSKEEILVLSYTRATADELKMKLVNELGESISVNTFHELGKDIIAKSNKIQPKIQTDLLEKFIKREVLIHLKDKEYAQKFIKYLADGIPAKEEDNFDDKESYEEYIRLNPQRTIKGEIVKSHGEREIANFFTLNNVKYVYEQDYHVDTRTEEHTQYIPDFYLPEYDIYVEYFGIDRDGSVASYIIGKEDKSGSELYNESMDWKRKTHKENKSKMIEVYSYDKFEGKLLERLESKLRENGVKLEEISIEQYFETMDKEIDAVLSKVVDEFSKYIDNIRKCNFKYDEVVEMISHSKEFSYNSLVLSLIEPIWQDYDSNMRKHKIVDFPAMINTAYDHVRKGDYVHPYKMVIIDEYQDISIGNFKLLRELRKSKDFNLFCVGDDWQSIYRFNGSKIDYIIDFEKYWGISEKSEIVTTYRFSDKLTEISGNFIMKNDRQIKKKLIGKREQKEFPLRHLTASSEKYLNKLIFKEIEKIPPNKEVYLLGRNSKDLEQFEIDTGIKSRQHKTYSEDGKKVIVTKILDIPQRNDLTVMYANTHSSKGLEADYVFIINNKDGYTGFPSQIPVSPFNELILGGDYDYEYSEERRLFYVALTRAKEFVYIATIKNKESLFAKELLEEYKDELSPSKPKRKRKTKSYGKCPKCGGDLYKRKGKTNEFLGCSNFATEKCKYTESLPSVSKN